MGERITDALMKRLTAPDRGSKIIFDSHSRDGADRIRGFGVRVQAPTTRNPEGCRAFVFNYSASRRERRITIGAYPAWSVAAARQRARELRKLVDAGGDPAEEKAQERDAPRVSDLATRYREEHLSRKAPEGRRHDETILEKYILPRLRDRKVASVHEGDARALHKAITDAGKPVRANRVLSVLSAMFTLAMRRREGEDVPWRTPALGNPCKGVERNREQGRERFYSSEELARIAEALDSYPGKTTANLLRFVMLTGCRPGEAIQATWDQIDLKAGAWTKPSSHTKQRRVHRVPLMPPAIELLRRVRKATPKDCPFLFPGRRQRKSDAWAPLQQYRDCWRYVVETAKLAPDAEGHAPRVYDLRHSFASLGAGRGLSLPIIGALLGHTQHRTTQRYAHLADDPLKEAVNVIGSALYTNRATSASIHRLPKQKSLASQK